MLFKIIKIFKSNKIYQLINKKLSKNNKQTFLIKMIIKMKIKYNKFHKTNKVNKYKQNYK
jgi:hypothetical protein